MKKAEKIISEMLEEYRKFNPVNATSQAGMKKMSAYPFYVKMVKQAQKEAYKEGFEKSKKLKNKTTMKQTFEIPEGCNRVTIEQQGRQIITTFEPEFKEGDVLFVEENMPYLSTVFVFKKNIDNNRNESYVAIVDGDYGCTSGSVNGFPRHATESEKQKLFDALAKEGKQWNAETKQVEDIKPKRWRADKYQSYYTIDDYFEVCESEENNDHIDEKRYIYGSYFQTEQQAEEASEKIKELLNQINP